MQKNVRTGHMCVRIIVHNCRTQHGTEQFWLSSLLSWRGGGSLRAGIPPRYVTSHPDQRSLLPSVGREMSTGQSAAMLYSWE